MSNLTFNQELALATAIGEQIWREQSLVANRMTWNLTFQGFMIAGFALIATADFSTPDRMTLELVVAAAGVIVALATLAGVYAAHRQSSYLKKCWVAQFTPPPTDAEGESGQDAAGEPREHEFLPRPFSDSTGSRLGRIAPRTICVTVAIMWIVLGGFAWAGLEAEPTVTIEGPARIEVPGPQPAPAPVPAPASEAK